MEIPIIKYEITNRDIIDTIVSGLLVVFGLTFIIICENKFTGIILKKSKNITLNILYFFIHIILLLLLIMFIRYITQQMIANKFISASACSFIGPTIGAASLYFSSNIHMLVNLIK